MNSRYLGKVVTVPDDYTVIINKGSTDEVGEGEKFIVVGLGEVIIDPDTK